MNDEYKKTPETLDFWGFSVLAKCVFFISWRTPKPYFKHLSSSFVSSVLLLDNP
jgi:hypothetical protein